MACSRRPSSSSSINLAVKNLVHFVFGIFAFSVRELLSRQNRSISLAGYN